jgi:hypothetical protein
MTVEEAGMRIVDREEREANTEGKRTQKRQKRTQLSSVVLEVGSNVQR